MRQVRRAAGSCAGVSSLCTLQVTLCQHSTPLYSHIQQVAVSISFIVLAVSIGAESSTSNPHKTSMPCMGALHCVCSCPTWYKAQYLCSISTQRLNNGLAVHAVGPAFAEAAAAAAAAAADGPEAEMHSQAQAEAARLTDNLLPDWTAAASGPFPGAGLIPAQSLPQGSAPGEAQSMLLSMDAAVPPCCRTLALFLTVVCWQCPQQDW